MTGYAPNPKSIESAAASLTSGLLARKGHAAPAVDAVAHEGVEIDMMSATPKPRARVIEAQPVETPYAPSENNESAVVAEPDHHASVHEENRAAVSAFRQRASITLDAAPENWTVTSENALRRKPIPVSAIAPAKSREPGAANLRATVKFRMPAADFVRLRLASRAMRESCQTIIIDAIAAYLDANEVEIVDGVTTRQEVERLIKKRTRS